MKKNIFILGLILSFSLCNASEPGPLPSDEPNVYSIYSGVIRDLNVSSFDIDSLSNGFGIKKEILAIIKRFIDNKYSLDSIRKHLSDLDNQTLIDLAEAFDKLNITIDETINLDNVLSMLLEKDHKLIEGLNSNLRAYSKKFIRINLENGLASYSQKCVLMHKNINKYSNRALDYIYACSSSCSNDGNFLVTSNKDNNVTVFDLKKGTKKEIAHNCLVLSANISPDGKYILTSNYKGLVQLFDINGNVICSYQSKGKTLSNFSKDGNSIVIGNDKKLIVLDLNMKKQHTLHIQTNEIFSVNFSEKNDIVIAGCKEEVILWDLNNTTPQNIAVKAAIAKSVILSQDNIFVAGGNIPTLAMDCATQSINFRTNGSDFIDLAQNESLLMTAKDNIIFIWNSETGKLVYQIDCNEPVSCARFLGNANSISVLLESGKVVVYEVKDKEEQKSNSKLFKALAIGAGLVAIAAIPVFYFLKKSDNNNK